MNEKKPRKPRNDKGEARKPPHEQLKARHPMFNDPDWEWCTRQPGGASAYLRRLVEQDRRGGLRRPGAAGGGDGGEGEEGEEE